MTGSKDRDLFGHDLFDEPTYPERPGHVRDCDTSTAAADSLDDSLLTRMRAQVFTIIDLRPRGATCDEIEVALNLRHQTASARVRELALGGLIFDTGERRETRSGRPARVYRPARIARRH
jgi:hypothetical protein